MLQNNIHQEMLWYSMQKVNAVIKTCHKPQTPSSCLLAQSKHAVLTANSCNGVPAGALSSIVLQLVLPVCIENNCHLAPNTMMTVPYEQVFCLQ